MRRVGGVLCGMLALLLGVAAEAWAFGFSVEPARVQVSVPAGKRRGQTVTVRNERTDASVHLRLYVRDIIYLPDGTHEFPPVGSTTWSCAEWVTIAPTELEVPAGSTRDVRISVSVPPDARGGRYAVVFFETTPSYTEEGIGVNFRVGALVEAVIRGTEQSDASMKALSFTAPASFQADIFNSGNVLVRPKGAVKVFNEFGKKIRQVEFNPEQLGVLPQTLRVFTIQLEEPLPSGAYRVRAEVDYGARTLMVGERAFEVP